MAHELLKRKIAKSFPGFGRKKFKGTIEKIEPVDGEDMCLVIYEDGDQEHLSFDEASQYLIDEAGTPVKKQSPKKNKRGRPSNPGRRAGAEPGTVHSPSRRQKQRSYSEDSESETGANVIQRYAMRASSSSSYPRRSLAVAVNNTLFVSSISKPHESDELANKLIEGKDTEFVAKAYRGQAEYALQELMQALQQAGCGKDYLVSVDVKMKDVEEGWQPFTKVWNKWLGQAPNPALSICESFLGNHDVLVSVSAIAALPTD